VRDDRKSLDDLVTEGDLDELVRTVDRLAEAGRFEELIELRDRCRGALSTGRQLWPVAAAAEYRIALDGPAPLATAVALANTGRFTLGPLTEVVASRLTWSELRPYLPNGPERSFIAHERVLRGEDLRGDLTIDRSALDVPLVLTGWEPAYRLPHYHPDRVEHLAPVPPPLAAVAVGSVGRPEPLGDLDWAVRDLVAPWVEQSNGTVRAVSVHGGALDAVSVIEPSGFRIGAVDRPTALDSLFWAASGGGAFGRRRGGARARQAVWWFIAAVAQLNGDEASDPVAIGEAVTRLRWFQWDASVPSGGWQLRLAVDDQETGRAVAIVATDQV
jgi:hypothetical protein